MYILSSLDGTLKQVRYKSRPLPPPKINKTQQQQQTTKQQTTTTTKSPNKQQQKNSNNINDRALEHWLAKTDFSLTSFKQDFFRKTVKA